MKRDDSPQPAADELAVWEFAGLLLTYGCNARCAQCYVYSGPRVGGRMPRDLAIRLWGDLDRLAAAHGMVMRIHLAGGEPFADWPHLLSIVRGARDAGLTPLEKIETNAFWASREGLVRSRLEQLDALGMQTLVVSSDIFHQQFVPFDRVRRCVEIARRVLGRGRVRVRWWDYYNNPVDPRRLDERARRLAFAESLRRHPERMTGRAADELADLMPLRPAKAFRHEHCVAQVLRGRHVHVDPSGHVFPGVCSGIILGNVGRRRLDDLWRDLAQRWREHPVVATVVAGGSYALMKLAQAHGYRERPQGYASKCHLCHHVRAFLFRRRLLPDFVGPAECYGDAAHPPPLAAEECD